MNTVRNYSADDLLELSEWGPSDQISLGSAGDITGVVMPRDYQHGQVITPGAARKLAAQLLREADLHDAIFDAGFRAGQENMSGG